MARVRSVDTGTIDGYIVGALRGGGTLPRGGAMYFKGGIMEKYRAEFNALCLNDELMDDSEENFQAFARKKERWEKGRESVRKRIQTIREVVSNIDGAHSVIMFIRKEIPEGEAFKATMVCNGEEVQDAMKHIMEKVML